MSLDTLPLSPWSPADLPVPVSAGQRNLGRLTPLQRPLTGRVLHVINGEYYSGAERVQDLLALQLPKHGFAVGFACVKPDRFPAARQAQQAPLYSTPMRNKVDLRAAREVARLVRREEYCLLHAHTPRSALVARAAAALARVPFIYHVHSPTSRDSTRRWQNLANQWMERVSLLGASALITVSDSLRQHMLAAGIPARRLFTVPNGVPPAERLRPATPPVGHWTLGMTALFRPRKGLEILLDALALLRHEHYPVHLRAVGPFESEEYRRSILARAVRLGVDDAITWTGFTAEVGAELTQMDLLVLPSLFGEGLPMVVLEAMAAGVPVVASRVEGVPEAIEHQVTGILVKPQDAFDLARGIASVMRGEVDWTGLREWALGRHAREFSDSRMAERVAAVYRQVLSP